MFNMHFESNRSLWPSMYIRAATSPASSPHAVSSPGMAASSCSILMQHLPLALSCSILSLHSILTKSRAYGPSMSRAGQELVLASKKPCLARLALKGCCHARRWRCMRRRCRGCCCADVHTWSQASVAFEMRVEHEGLLYSLLVKRVWIFCWRYYLMSFPSWVIFPISTSRKAVILLNDEN